MNGLLECGGCLWVYMCRAAWGDWGSLPGGMGRWRRASQGRVGVLTDGSMSWIMGQAWPAGATVAAADQARRAERGQASAPMEGRGRTEGHIGGRLILFKAWYV